MPLGKGWPTVRSQAQTRLPALSQQLKQTLVQHGYGFLVLRLENEIGCFVRIVEKVVQLIRVPEPVVTDIFETLPTHGVCRRRVRIVTIPKILVEHIVSPRDVVTLGQLPETASIICFGVGSPAVSSSVGPTSMLATTFFIADPAWITSGQCIRNGMRIDASYAVLLSNKPCSPN
jgi:hypothetical protein